jgi:peptidoglycan/xylan/chitin deacetylase (PgdA/CDA1 family)
LNHRRMNAGELERSLADGSADLRELAGVSPQLVRPPFWAYDERTLAAYRRHGLAMLLTDVSARDGKIYGFIASPRRVPHFRAKLKEVRESLQQNKLPIVRGVVPVVITFHDTNLFTARHMGEYLNILIAESRRTGLVLADPPFYGAAAQLAEAALVRAERAVYGVSD